MTIFHRARILDEPWVSRLSRPPAGRDPMPRHGLRRSFAPLAAVAGALFVSLAVGPTRPQERFERLGRRWSKRFLCQQPSAATSSTTQRNPAKRPLSAWICHSSRETPSRLDALLVCPRLKRPGCEPFFCQQHDRFV